VVMWFAKDLVKVEKSAFFCSNDLGANKEWWVTCWFRRVGSLT
jgi:hypothetical protein